MIGQSAFQWRNILISFFLCFAIDLNWIYMVFFMEEIINCESHWNRNRDIRTLFVCFTTNYRKSQFFQINSLGWFEMFDRNYSESYVGTWCIKKRRLLLSRMHNDARHAYRQRLLTFRICLEISHDIVCSERKANRLIFAYQWLIRKKSKKNTVYHLKRFLFRFAHQQNASDLQNQWMKRCSCATTSLGSNCVQLISTKERPAMTIPIQF